MSTKKQTPESKPRKTKRLKNRSADFLQGLHTPLQTLIGYAELLIENLHKQCLTAYYDDAARLSEGVDTFSALIEELEHETDLDDAEKLAQLRHDMRNALGVAKGYSEMIAEELEDDGNESMDDFLNVLQNEATQLLGAVDKLVRPEGKSDVDSSLQKDIRKIFLDFKKPLVRDREAVKGGDILVVDDNENNLNLLAHQLKKQGHFPRSANSGNAALVEMQNKVPDIVLLDLLMPDMNGVEVMQCMREKDELKSIPVIVTTGLNDEVSAVRCIEIGATDYLTKPINPTLLMARIDACMEKRIWHLKEKEYQQELEKSYRFVRQVFGRYVSDEVVKVVLDNEDGLDMGGAKRKVTLMMTDLRGFTAISENLGAEKVVLLLNNYLGAMSDIVAKYNGIVSAFIGDAVFAVFGGHVIDSDDSERAVACAVAMQMGVEQVNEKNRSMDLPEIQMGIGINTGVVVVGNIGSETRSTRSLIGHHVNLAARVESCTVGGQILISQYTLEDVEVDLKLGESFDIKAKGLSGKIKVHTVEGIGGKYNLHLPKRVVVHKPLVSQLPIEMHLLEAKSVRSTAVMGYLTAMSETQFVIRVPTELSKLQDFVLHIKETVPADHVKNSEIYIKVISIRKGEDSPLYKECPYRVIAEVTSIEPVNKSYLETLTK